MDEQRRAALQAEGRARVSIRIGGRLRAAATFRGQIIFGGAPRTIPTTWRTSTTMAISTTTTRITSSPRARDQLRRGHALRFLHARCRAHACTAYARGLRNLLPSLPLRGENRRCVSQRTPEVFESRLSGAMSDRVVYAPVRSRSSERQRQSEQSSGSGLVASGRGQTRHNLIAETASSAFARGAV